MKTKNSYILLISLCYFLLSACSTEKKVISNITESSFILNNRSHQFETDSVFHYYYIIKNNSIDVKKLIMDSNITCSSIIYCKKSILLLSFGDSIETTKITFFKKMGKSAKFSTSRNNWLTYKIDYGGLVTNGSVPDWLLEEKVFIITIYDSNWE